MGRSSGKNKGRRPAHAAAQITVPWEDNETFELVAYLDYGADQHLKQDEVLEGFSTWLHQQLNRRFTTKRILRKLRWLFHEYGSKDLNNSDFHLMFKIGSRAIPLYAIETRSDPARRAEEIKKTKREEFLHSPRKLRSVSGTPTGNRVLCTAARLRSIKSADQPYSVSVERSGSPDSLRLINATPANSRNSPPATPILNRLELTNDAQSVDRAVQTNSVKEEAMDFELTSPVLKSRSPSVNEEHLNDQTMENNSWLSNGVPETPSYTPPSTVQASPAPRGDGSVHALEQMSLQDHLNEMEKLKTQVQDLERTNIEVKEANRERAYWEDKYRSSQAELCELRETYNRVQSRLHDTLKPDGMAFLRELNRSDTRVDDLQKQVNELTNLKFPELKELNRPVSPQTDLRKIGMLQQDMSYDLASIFSEQRYIDHRSTIAVAPTSDLQALWQKIRFPDNSERAQADAESCIQLMEEPRTVCRAIVAAALSLWVFEVDMRDLFPSIGLGKQVEPEHRLLQKFREVLLTKDAIVARNLEIAAHRALFQDDFFEDFVLPEKARSLAQRTVQTLAPFFKPTQDGSGVVSELSLVSENDAERLVDAFTHAMKLRCVLLLSTDEFAHIMCPPGATFRQKSMTPIPESQMPEQLDPHIYRGIVNFTMVPGLQVTKSNRRYLDYRGLSCLDGTLGLGAQSVTMAKVLVQRTSS